MILPSSDGAGTAADGRVLGRPAKAGLSADGEMTKEWTYELNLNNDRMKLKFLWMIVFTSTVLVCGAKEPGRRIFVYGGEVEPKFVEYVCGLIGKADPRICYLPTASGDNDDNIRHWEFICKTLGIEPHVMRVWIDSETQRQSFEDLLLGMDAIVVGGGNTLNMMGIWKYQEIDAALRKAYERGIVLSGGSAGSLCWFAGGVSDSRPCNLSVVEGLGLLPFSHCPHYDVAAKRTFYDDLVVRRKLTAGYACEDHAGILFVDGTVADAVSSNHQARSYRVARGRSGLKIDTLESRVLLKKGALDESAYRKESFSGHVGDWMQAPYSMRTPFLAFVSVQRLFADGRYSEYAPYPRFANGLRGWRTEPWTRRPGRRNCPCESVRFWNAVISRRWFRKRLPISTRFGTSFGSTRSGNARVRTSAEPRRRMPRRHFGRRLRSWRPQTV